MHKVRAIWGLNGRGLLGLIAILLISINSQAQINTLCIKTGDQVACQSVRDSAASVIVLKNLLTENRIENYLAASIDSLATKNDTLFAYHYLGETYTTIVLRKHNFGKGYLSDSTNVSLSTSQFVSLQDQIITAYENNGYPFANIQLDHIEVVENQLVCNAQLFTYTPIAYDSLQIIGESEMSKQYLQRYLDIIEGEAYKELDVRAIDKKLRNLPLIKLNSATRVVFYQGLARVILDIDDIITDRVDGVVGFAPNSSNSEENTLLLTGEVHIELNNLFKSAKQLNLHWRNYLQRSQLLDVGFTYPYLFNTKLGINGELNINKYDTLFVNLKSKLSFRYQQRGNNYIEFYYQNINSNLITADTVAVRNTKSIPTNNPYNIDNYGVALYQRDFDYLPNPRKGYMVLIDAALGQKTILRNTQIDLVEFLNTETGQMISVYDTIDKKSLRGNISLQTELFIPIRKSSTIRQSLQVMGLFSDQVFFNELYNFGGFSSLRGFDENELFASKAAIYTIEYRYLLDENSNIGLFFNTALIENKLESDDLIYNNPIGFGAIANIKVGGGILNIAYALGQQLDNPIQLNTAKFHFGIVNYF